jgi:sulfate transport system permease protein
LSAIVLIPIAGLFLRVLIFPGPISGGWQPPTGRWQTYRLTFGASFVAALINAFLRNCSAWVLARISFPENASSMPWWIFHLRFRLRWPA